jgi:raffinose/stachyose/melibiose transport system permease protein
MSATPTVTPRRRLIVPVGARRAHAGMRRLPWAWALPAVVFLIAMHYVAVLAGAWYAFTDWSGSSAGAHFVGLRNFSDVFGDDTARKALLNTLKLALVFVVLVNAIGLALALSLHRALKSRNLLRALFFAPVVMSPLAVSYIWQFIFDPDGPLNGLLQKVGLSSLQETWLGSPTYALWAILVVLVWQFSGLAMVFYLAGLQSIPAELDEASAVDGARRFYRFRRITLPLLGPATTVSCTFMLVLALRVFDQVIALTNGGPVNASETLATQVYKQTFNFGKFGYGSALALVLTAVIVAIALAQLMVLRAREKRL